MYCCAVSQIEIALTSELMLGLLLQLQQKSLVTKMKHNVPSNHKASY